MRAFRTTASMAALFMMASPLAIAQDDTGAPASEEQMKRMADRLEDPAMQDSIAVVVEKIAGAMMKLPVGELAGAIENARPGSVKRDIPADAVLADLAGEDARDMPEMLGKQSRIAMGMMSGFARIFARMSPELENIMRDMGAEMERIE